MSYRQCHPELVEGSPGDPTWTEDSQRILFSGQQGTDTNLFALDVASGAIEQLTEVEGTLSPGSFSKDRTRYAYTFTDYRTPGDIWLGYMDGSWRDVHGAGAQRSDPKDGDPADYPVLGMGPQGDAQRVFNYVRLVRDADSTVATNTAPEAEAGLVDCIHEVGVVIDPVGRQEVAIEPLTGPQFVHHLLAELQRRALATDVEQEVL